jgi:reactive intermediate/imine deaminase
MAEKNSIWSEAVAAPEGHYPQALRLGEHLFASGLVATDAEGRLQGDGDAAAQTRQILRNLTELLTAASAQMSHVMKVTIYLLDLADEAAYDAASREFFFFQPPARTVVQVAALPKGARVQVDAQALVPAADPLSKVMI